MTIRERLSQAALEGAILGLKYGLVCLIAVVILQTLVADYLTTRERAMNGQRAFQIVTDAMNGQRTAPNQVPTVPQPQP